MYKVFIVEDERLVREGLRNNIRWEGSRFLFSGEATDGEMALAMIQDIKPDILMTDIRMPFMDGLELARIVRRTMPWIRIVILSGHDEFEYARDAISIGIDEYLLKPVDSNLVFATLDKVAVRIEEDNRKRLDLERLQNELASSHSLMVEKFLEELILGGIGMTAALVQAEKAGLDLLARRYVVCEAKIEYSEAVHEQVLSIRARVAGLLKERPDVIWFFRSYDRLVLIIKGETSDPVLEAAYQLSQSLKYDSERNSESRLTIGIGAVVERMGAIPESYAGAARVLRMLGGVRQGHIVGIRDIESGEIHASSFLPSDAPAAEKLRYASREDVPDLVRQWMQKLNGADFQSALMGYYLLMDVLMTASRIILEVGGDPQKILPEVDNPAKLFDVASRMESFAAFATEVIGRTIDFRDTREDRHYGRIIQKARSYINGNYGNSGISLHTVAAEVALSPNHFSTIFSQETGETFIEYLTRVRIEQARKLLTSGALRTADIAYAVGYNEPHYFSYLFKKHTGQTPRDFRTQALNAGTGNTEMSIFLREK